MSGGLFLIEIVSFRFLCLLFRIFVNLDYRNFCNFKKAKIRAREIAGSILDVKDSDFFFALR